MSWDPTQQGQGLPENKPQSESGQGPYSGYGSPENPYGTPLQNPFDPNVQNPYGTPPPQYSAPPPYGNAGYQQAGYEYVPPQGPRPLGVAIQELPQQYIKICTRPSVQSFLPEIGKADWAIVWVQLLALAVISAIFGYLATLITHAPAFTTGSSGAYTSLFTTLAVGGSVFSIVSVPLFFFIGAGVQYLLARAFRGEGTFLQQCYTALLYQVPLGIISRVVGLIPILGGIVAFALFIYGIVLNVFSIMAVHRLSGGRAIAVVLIPVGIVILLFICLAVILVALLAAAFKSANP
jgi:hypothetical protein